VSDPAFLIFTFYLQRAGYQAVTPSAAFCSGSGAFGRGGSAGRIPLFLFLACLLGKRLGVFLFGAAGGQHGGVLHLGLRG